MLHPEYVLNVVIRCLQEVSRDGASAIDYSSEGAGWVGDVRGNDRLAAFAVHAAILSLPVEHMLTLMCQVWRSNPQVLEPWLMEIAPFVERKVDPDGNFGRLAVMYWIRRWLGGPGSARDAAGLFGRSHDTHAVFYRERVRPTLDSWYVAARGALEPIIECHYCDYAEVA